MKLFDGARRHLNLAIAGFAILQGLDVFFIELRICEVGLLRRIAEFSDRQYAGELAQAVEIAGKLSDSLSGRLS